MDRHYNYSNSEYVAMVQLYARADYDSNAARRLYAEPQHLDSLRRRGILNPQVPRAHTIIAATQRLHEHGQFKRPSHAQGRGAVEREPRRSTRTGAARKTNGRPQATGTKISSAQSSSQGQPQEGVFLWKSIPVEFEAASSVEDPLSRGKVKVKTEPLFNEASEPSEDDTTTFSEDGVSSEISVNLKQERTVSPSETNEDNGGEDEEADIDTIQIKYEDSEDSDSFEDQVGKFEVEEHSPKEVVEKIGHLKSICNVQKTKIESIHKTNLKLKNKNRDLKLEVEQLRKKIKMEQVANNDDSD